MSRQSELAALARVADTGALSNRNMVYNGAMQVHQRGNQSVSSGNSYSLDRWEVATTGGSAAYDLKQSTDVPTGQGFANSFQLDVTTADVAMGSGDGYIFRQAFEGQDLQAIKKGSSNAQQVTVQFWVKSPKAGTHIIELYDTDNTRQVSASYSVTSANTWEKFTVTFPADTTGAFDNDNARSLILQWWLAAGTDFTSGTLNTSWASSTNANRVVGQVNCLDDAANNFYITGIQLEVGDTATEFEHPRSYGDELAKCQRYYEQFTTSSGELNYTYGQAFNATAGETAILYTHKRAAPTITKTGDMKVWYGASSTGNVTISYIEIQNTHATVSYSGATGGSPSDAIQIYTGSSTATTKVDAEL